MKRFYALLCITVAFGFSTVSAQNEKFKALFIYNFTNYIEWPSSDQKSFVIAVLGDSPIISELTAISKIKKVGNLTIDVVQINSTSEIGNANIVFVPSSKKKALLEVSQTSAGKSVLIITDEANGNFGINFVELGPKQSFQISRTNIESHHLKVNSTLIALGTAVN